MLDQLEIISIHTSLEAMQCRLFIRVIFENLAVDCISKVLIMLTTLDVDIWCPDTYHV